MSLRKQPVTGGTFHPLQADHDRQASENAAKAAAEAKAKEEADAAAASAAAAREAFCKPGSSHFIIFGARGSVLPAHMLQDRQNINGHVVKMMGHQKFGKLSRNQSLVLPGQMRGVPPTFCQTIGCSLHPRWQTCFLLHVLRGGLQTLTVECIQRWGKRDSATSGLTDWFNAMGIICNFWFTRGKL